MAMKFCTKLETAKERCPIVFQCHPSNFKVTRDKTSPILTQVGRFRTIGRSQLSNPSDLPCLILCVRWYVQRRANRTYCLTNSFKSKSRTKVVFPSERNISTWYNSHWCNVTDDGNGLVDAYSYITLMVENASISDTRNMMRYMHIDYA